MCARSRSQSPMCNGRARAWIALRFWTWKSCVRVWSRRRRACRLCLCTLCTHTSNIVVCALPFQYHTITNLTSPRSYVCVGQLFIVYVRRWWLLYEINKPRARFFRLNYYHSYVVGAFSDDDLEIIIIVSSAFNLEPLTLNRPVGGTSSYAPPQSPRMGL